jgi:hypothetical protein
MPSLALPLLILLAVASSLPAVACGAPEPDRIVGLDGRGEIRLASGRRAVLAGIHLPDEDPWRGAALARLREREDVSVTRLAAEDRWGRAPVRAEAEGLDLARGLVEGGLAAADPASLPEGCPGPPAASRFAAELLALEAAARERGLGLWRADRYKPVAAEDEEGVRARAGRFALVEGRIRSVGERRARTYLNLGPDGRRHLTITISKRTWSNMVEKGLSATALRGRRVRVRGVVEEGRGPAVELAAPEVLELLEGSRARP